MRKESYSFSEVVVQTCSVEKVWACNFIKKETLAQVFSCEFCQIFKNTSFYRTLMAVSAFFYFLKIISFYQLNFDFLMCS